MLVLKLELHNANNGRVHEIGRVVIANDDSGTDLIGNYDVKQRDGEPNNAAIWSKPHREGRVDGYPRSNNAWSLAARAIAVLGFA